MLKYFLISILIISLVILACLFLLGYVARNQPEKQPVTGLLAPCPETLNCVCSEYLKDQAHYIKAIDLSIKSHFNDLSQVVPIIIDMGGEVVVQDQHYLAATFKSRVFGFIDDFELRLDFENKRLQLRSASRVGRSDLGANKSRTDRFKKEFQSRFQSTEISGVS